MSAEQLLVVDDVSLNFGGIKALSQVSLQAELGRITAVIGPERCRQDQPPEHHFRSLSSKRRTRRL